MLSPTQILLLHDYFSHQQELYGLCDRYDCDVDQMQEIIGEITPLLPGKGIDFNAILSKDPLACDPLILHCNRSIAQLDELFSRLVGLYDSRSDGLSQSKRTTVNVPPDWANPSFHDGKFHFPSNHDGTEKIETASTSDPQRFKILETAMKCIDRSLKIQITLTQRQEKLQKVSKSQSEASARDSQPPETPMSPSAGRPHTGITAMRGYSLNGGRENTNRWRALEASDNKHGPEGREKETSVPSVFQTETSCAGCRTRLPKRQGRKKAQSQPEASARDLEDANLLSLPGDDALDAFREEEHVTEPDGTYDASEKFGPPKEFTPSPAVEELFGDRYPWRKELKAKKAASRLPNGLQPAGELKTDRTSSSQPEASARDNPTEAPASNSPASPRDTEDQPFHKRE